VSGQPFAAFADTNIFKPLGMTHTHFHDDVTRIVPNRATGYSRAANGFRVATRTYTDTLVGNAGLFTTVGDLLRWERNFAKPQVGGPALIAEMQTPTIASRWSATNHYGLGLEIAQHRGMRTVGHGGADQGRRANVVRYPDRDLSIAVLCNLDDIDPTVLTKRVAEIVLDGQFPNLPTTRQTSWPSTGMFRCHHSSSKPRSVCTATYPTNRWAECSFATAG
jgi:CubicO group peptidase (beta-lactamase class C family)